MDAADFLTTDEIIRAARRNLSDWQWAYLVGGAESETTLRRNRLALDSIGLPARVLRDVSRVDTSVSFLGHKLRMPVILAPIGSMQHLSADGALGFAKAASRFGTMFSMAQMTPPSLEEVAAASDGPKLFQLYVMGDDDWLRALLTRVRDAGYGALVLTVDSPYHGRHERQLLNPVPGRGAGGGVSSGRPSAPSPAPLRYAPSSSRGRRDETASPRPNYLASVTWQTLDRIRELWEGTLILKGVQTGEDASMAVEHGVDVVWVSNHGGRQMDHALGAIDVLPEVVEAIGGREKVVFDSGILRASDAVKALALGADVVAIGRLQGWGMAAAGVEGVVRVLEILENELVSAMGLLGVSRIDELDASLLTKAAPVTLPHEMSAFANIEGGRVV